VGFHDGGQIDDGCIASVWESRIIVFSVVISFVIICVFFAKQSSEENFPESTFKQKKSNKVYKIRVLTISIKALLFL